VRRRGTRQWALFCIALLANLVLLFWPGGVGGDGPVHVDKAVHAVSFAALAWTGFRAGLPARLLVVVLVVHAATSEVVQATLLPDRSGDAWDVVADLTGVLVGSVAFLAASWGHGRADERGRGRDPAGRQPDAR
jgi:hypothetical protein